jgi:acyl-CoA synthetase (AMP-forming)/AMP-acid ligase II
MASWLNLGQILKVNAKKFPNTIALKDKHMSLTYPDLNVRVNKLSNSLLSLELKKGDKVAVLLENCIEIVEIYLATAKLGLVIVPINFRLASGDIEYIANDSEASAFVVHEEFMQAVNSIRPNLPNIEPERYIVVGGKKDGYIEYEEFLGNSQKDEPDVMLKPSDTWVLLYTSGTTGKPKGVLRSHESFIAFYLINGIDFSFSEHDICLNIMPLCHVNSVFFTFTFTYIGGTVYIHPARNFRAKEILDIIEKEKITFISLIPTHYNLILNVPEQARGQDVTSIRKLLCSSAPVRKSMKKSIMEFFPGAELYEGYGSTEAGIVTVLKPEYQMSKLGSIGFESLGTDSIKILDEDGSEVGIGEVGELYSRGPMLFDSYHGMPEKTAASFKGEWFSAGDMATRDENGFYQLVDRKDNMIITGGEHVYPSEVEEVIGSHPNIFDVAVIGLPDEKWGEKVIAVVIPKGELDVGVVREYCDDKIARFKIPKQVIFIEANDMPRTATGKILHRVLRERYADPEA